MSRLAHLRLLVERRSSAPPVVCDLDALRAQLGYDVASMHARGFDPFIVAEHETFNQHLEQFLLHEQFGEYLATLTPQHTYGASGVEVLPLDGIREEIQELAPGALIFPHGYMPFAVSVGGNAMCLHAESGAVVWVDHDSFSQNEITYKDRSTGDYHTVPFTPDHIAQAVVTLAEDLDVFLGDLLNDRLGAKLDALD